MISLIVSILALGIIVMIHEFGHFFFAKLFGVGVVEFAVGFGPRLISGVVGETRYSLRAMPFGGACMMLGEAGDEEDPDSAGLNEISNAGTDAPEVAVIKADPTDPYAEESIVIDGRAFSASRQFVKQKAWKRFLIIAGGPLFNFILAFLLSLVLVGVSGYDKPEIRFVTDGMPAAEAGLAEGDIIYSISVNGHSQRVALSSDIALFMLEHADELSGGNIFSISYVDAEDGSRNTISISPVYDEELARYRLGFSYSYAYKRCSGPAELVRYSLERVRLCFSSSIISLRMILKGNVTRQDVMGPVRMVAEINEDVSEASTYGMDVAVLTLFEMMILISGSLGFMNLLPLPALDGGRLVFILIEMVIGRAVPQKFEAYVHAAGLCLLLVLMVAVLFNDISLLLF